MTKEAAAVIQVRKEDSLDQALGGYSSLYLHLKSPLHPYGFFPGSGHPLNFSPGLLASSLSLFFHPFSMLLPKELSVLKESYLFLGCAGSLLLCIFLSSCGPQGLREWVSHGDVFSCLGARALGCADCTSWGTWAPRPWSTGSTAVVPGSAATRHVGLSRTRD